MAVRNLLGNHHIGKRVKYGKTQTKKPHGKLHQELQAKGKQTDETASGLFVPNFGIVPHTPVYTAYELAKIGQENIWYNYASAKEILELYKIAMHRSGKCLNSFNLDSLIRFIEGHLFVDNEEIGGIPEIFELVESNNFICFDSEKNKVDYRQTIHMYVHSFEDITSHWYQISTKSKRQMEFRNEYQVLISMITPIDHVYLLDFNEYIKQLDLEKIKEIMENSDYNNGENIKNKIRMIKRAMKYSESNEFRKKQQYFTDLYMEGEQNLLDRVTEKIKSKKYRVRVDPDELCQSLQYVYNHMEPFKSIVNGDGYYSDLSPFSNSIINDGSSKGVDLCIWYLALVEIDMQNIAIRDLNHEFSLLDNSREIFINYLNHLRKII